ncbi:Ubiquitin carboxyl-terminal hydrolase 20, partial [Stylosanthes scabra]|nr:Ubiquitin carboxyl-terminal hydrolase 20 [Stylosanthes scabra]
PAKQAVAVGFLDRVDPNMLRCCNCGHSSSTYEPLIDLSLEIDNVDTLPSALESFTKVENIDAKLKCDSCKEE